MSIQHTYINDIHTYLNRNYYILILVSKSLCLNNGTGFIPLNSMFTLTVSVSFDVNMFK